MSYTGTKPSSTESSFSVPYDVPSTNGFYMSGTLPTTAAASITLPLSLDAYPATFFVTLGGERPVDVCGFVTVYSGIRCAVHGGTAALSIFDTSVANHVVVAMSAGDLVIANHSINAATAATNVYIHRLH